MAEVTQITQMVTPLSTPPTWADPANFDQRADTFVLELQTLSAQLNTLITQINGMGTTMSGYAATAVAAKTACQVAQSAAQIAASMAESYANQALNAAAPLWNAGTAYAAPAVVAGSDGNTYRAIQPSTGKDPVTSPDYWRPITLAALPGIGPDQYPLNRMLSALAYQPVAGGHQVILAEYADDAAAAAASPPVPLGGLYHTAGTIKMRAV